VTNLQTLASDTPEQEQADLYVGENAEPIEADA